MTPRGVSAEFRQAADVYYELRAIDQAPDDWHITLLGYGMLKQQARYGSYQRDCPRLRVSWSQSNTYVDEIMT